MNLTNEIYYRKEQFMKINLLGIAAVNLAIILARNGIISWWLVVLLGMMSVNISIDFSNNRNR